MLESEKIVTLVLPSEEVSFLERQVNEFHQMNPSQQKIFLESLSAAQNFEFIQCMLKQLRQIKEEKRQKDKMIAKVRSKLFEQIPVGLMLLTYWFY